MHFICQFLHEWITSVKFVSTRVSEIKSKTDTTSEWYWIPTNYNLADMGTRETVTPGDLKDGSDYQNGMPWMCQNADTWPVLPEPAVIPPEEMLKAERACVATTCASSIDLSRYSTFAKAVFCFSSCSMDPIKNNLHLRIPLLEHVLSCL